MKGVFVTAIGTDCGKTHICTAILRELVAQGRPALALKPLMSGYTTDRMETSDAGRLLLAIGQPVSPATVADICWKSFAEPLAPNVAARRQGVELEYGEMLAFVRTRLTAHDGPALVEGAGGVMSPLTDTRTNIDLAEDLGLPVVLLAYSYLGAVSHTLTAVDALSRRGLTPKAIIVTEPSPQSAPAASFVDELARWTEIQLFAAPFARTEYETRQNGVRLTTYLFG